jgi:hypothetical protein
MKIKRENVFFLNISIYGTCLFRLKSSCQIQATGQERIQQLIKIDCLLISVMYV